MATLQQLEAALKNADAAGDMDAARKLAAAVTRARQDKANLIPDTQVPETIPHAPEPTLGEQAIGAAQVPVALVSGAAGGTLGMLGGTLKGLAEQILSGKFGTPEAADLVEQEAVKGAQAGAQMTQIGPFTETGAQMTRAAAETLAQTIPAYIPVVGPVGAIVQGTRMAAPAVESAARAAAVPIAQGARRVADAGRGVASAAKEMVAGGEFGPSAPAVAGGARGASIGASATPLEVQRATEARVAGVKLTEGEIKRSPEMLAWEKEKAHTPEYQAPFMARQQENNRAALSKFETLIDDTGATSADLGDTGIKVVDTLMSGWKKEKAKTQELYAGFRKSPESAAPVDAAPLVDFLNGQPVGVSGITGITDTARQNAIRLGLASVNESGELIPAPSATLGTLEDFRQSISAMGVASPNDKRLASVLKRTVDEIGDPIAGPTLKAMRAQRANQARKFENRAIVSRLLMNKRGGDDPQVPVEEVFRKTILTARPSEIQHIKRVLSTVDGGADTWSELRAATIKHLRDSAESGIGSDNLPIVSSVKLDRAVKQLDANGKLDLVLGKKDADHIRNLNQVLKYIQTAPPMTSVNNSGTARTVMALIAEAGVTGAATGIPVPIVHGLKLLRNEVKDRKIKARITQALNYEPKQN